MARQPLPPDTILGSETDQYRIDTVLGPGGFGITYLGRSLRLDRDVAIKEYFPAEFAYRDGSHTVRSIAHGSSSFFDQGKRYFIEEARTLGKFRHEHIVRVIGLIEENNTAYMVLEFEEGLSLKQWLRNLGRRPTQRQIDALLEPMLSALEAIHAKGIFHRDIAPDNIIIRPSGKPVLIDFGAARQLVRGTSQTLGAIVKHGYSPPEQYTVDTRLQGAWSDIYALCATFYHVIMGQPPEEASKRQLNDTLLPIEDQLDDVNRQLYRESFIAGLDAGLQLKPRDRPQTIAELREIILDGADISAPRTDSIHDDRNRERGSRTSPTGPTRRRTGSDAGGRPAAGRAATGPTPRAQSARGPAAALDQDSDDRGTVLRRADHSEVDDWGEERRSASGREGVPRVAGNLAFAIAVLAAGAFVWAGGTNAAAGLPALVVACLGVCGGVVERLVAMQRAAAEDLPQCASSAAAAVAGGLAILWLAQVGLLALSPALPLAALAAVFAFTRYGGWVPALVTAVVLLQGLVVADALLGNIGQASTSLPVLMTAYLVIVLAGLVGAVLMWSGNAGRTMETAT